MNAALGLALTLILGVSAQASAQSRLEEARALYSEQRFAEALAVLRVAREAPSSSHEEKLGILVLLASCQVAEGLRDEAESSFAELLSLDPSWAPERGTSPKILDVWEAARARVPSPPEAPPQAPKVKTAAPAAAVAALPPTPSHPALPEPAGLFERKPAAWITAGLALCAGIAGGYLQLRSADSAVAARNEPWSDTARNTHGRATSEATWALGLFVGAGAAGATSAALFVW
jgi:hypothetical protein